MIDEQIGRVALSELVVRSRVAPLLQAPFDSASAVAANAKAAASAKAAGATAAALPEAPMPLSESEAELLRGSVLDL